MASYIEVAAIGPNGAFPTKKSLKDQIALDPTKVRLSSVGGLNQPFCATWDQLASGVLRSDIRLTIVGPDPFRSRKWYASVKEGQNGQYKLV